MIDLVVFDLDGTLVDTPSGITKAFTATFAEMGASPCANHAIRATIGMPLAVAFRSLLGACVSESLVDHCIGTYQRKFNEIVLPSAKSLVYPGVAEGLDQLRADGVVLAVATSKFHANADSLLAAAGLRSAFSLVVGADEVDRPKPNPDMGEYVLGKLGVPATRAVMIGDTTHDVLMARAVGMRSIAVTYGVHGRRELLASKPTWVADDFSAVTRLLSAATEAA